MNRTATMSESPHEIGQSAGRENPANGTNSHRKVHVLVVDDSELIRRLVATMLRTAGYTVVLAENGRDALARLREHAVQLVVTDMMMPEMDGLELIAALRILRPDLPIIGMSGGSEKSDHCLERAKKLGATTTLAKPFQKQQMLEAVAQVLHEQLH
jgi:CheY-like chemotaxis protein